MVQREHWWSLADRNIDSTRGFAPCNLVVAEIKQFSSVLQGCSADKLLLQCRRLQMKLQMLLSCRCADFRLKYNKKDLEVVR